MGNPVVLNTSLLASILADTEGAEKTAFVPGDQLAQGGAPPMDPAAAGGGMPPGGMPMDPSMGGMAPGGMAPGGAGGMPMDPSMAAAGAPGAAPGAPPAAAPGAGTGKSTKVDPAVIHANLWQIKRALALVMGHLNISIPPDMMLGDAPDPAMLQQAQQSTQMIDQAASQSAAGVPAAGGAAGGDPNAQPKMASEEVGELIPSVGEGFDPDDLIAAMSPFAQLEEANEKSAEAAAVADTTDDLARLCRSVMSDEEK